MTKQYDLFTDEEKATIKREWLERDGMGATEFNIKMGKLLKRDPYDCLMARLLMGLKSSRTGITGELVDMSICEVPQTVEAAMEYRDYLRATSNAAWI